ncbi:HNH endonuclease signature motif containing protein [Paeniglutamicibacter antarcticus]
METTQFIASITHTDRTPGHTVTPNDELRSLLAAQHLVRDLGQRIASHTTSPTTAALFTHAAEDAHRTAAHTQLLAAQTARRTLAHELPETTFDTLATIHANSAPYIAGTTALPPDPRTVPTGRLVFKNTTDFLTGTLHIGYYEARERLRAIDRLLPGTDLYGQPTRAQFPHLAHDLATGSADPQEINAAARKLDKLTPQIHQHPNPDALTEDLEQQVSESIRHQDPRTTSKLLATIGTTLQEGITDIPEEILRTKLGLFYRGTTAGIGEFLIRTLPTDTETLLALCAQTDNPRTKAGDRQALLQQALTTGTGNEPSPRFPDFLIDPTTGQPLQDAATIRSLSLDPNGTHTGNLFTNNNGNGNAKTEPGTMNSTAYGPDGLTPPQRHLQGLMNLLKSAGQPGTRKKTSGLPSPRTLVIATLAELQEQAEKHGITTHGQQLTPAELRQRLCTGGALPMILGGKSQILDLGKEERYFPDYMREAILALYGGCLTPGCTVPPEHCEIHHYDYVSNGGKTEINSGVPQCSSHHHATHTGLITPIRDDDGLFSILLPKFMDPEQLPRRNTYWKATIQNPTFF